MQNPERNKSPTHDQLSAQPSPTSNPDLPFAAIRVVREAEHKYVIPTLVLAFARNPAARWIYPDAYQYLTHFPSFVQVLGGKAFDHNTAFTNSNYSAVALWLPPEVTPDPDLIVALLRRSTFEADQGDILAVFEQVNHHRPQFPHWRLPFIGVEPTQQGHSYDSALLQSALQQCDCDRVPAYLEASNPADIPFYKLFGFKVTDTIQVGKSPPIFPMIREPDPF